MPHFRQLIRGAATAAAIGSAVMVLLVSSCGKPDPVRIGFAGCLTGRLSDLGLSGRNGVMLAVEECNAAGGIRGRKVALLIRDDQHDPEVARAVDHELIDAGVTAIIGHMTSSMTMAVLELINQRKVVMISPTSSSHALTGRDDYFLRTVEESTAESNHLAAYAAERSGCTVLTPVLDLSNPTYTQNYLESFKTAFSRIGGRMQPPVTFVTGRVDSYRRLAETALTPATEGVLIITAALDAAMLCQQIRKYDAGIPIFVAAWANTPEFVAHGGEAVEGVVFSHMIDPEGRQPRYQVFRDHYLKRFSRPPDFAAILSYEAAQLLMEALAVTPDADGLKTVLLENRTIQGLQGSYTLDRFGDAHRDRFYITVRNNRYHALGR